MILYKLGLPLWAVIILLLPLLAFITLLDLARVYNPEIANLVPSRTIFGLILREHEKRAMSGSFWYLVGIQVVLIATTVLVGSSLSHPLREKAALSVLLLAFCDPAAAFVGKAFGGRVFPRIVRGKSVEGSLGAFLAGCIVTWIFFNWVAIPPISILPFSRTALCAGAVAAVAEMVQIGSMDDNLTIPIFSFIGLCAFL